LPHTNWIENYKIDDILEQQIPEIKAALTGQKHLHPLLRHEFLRNIVKDMTRFGTLGKKHFKVVGKQLYDRYPTNFADAVDGYIIGSGYDSTVKQLLTKNENMDRKHGTRTKLLAAVGDATEPVVKKKVTCRDQYGCVAYWPQFPAQSVEDLRQKQQELISLSKEKVDDLNMVLNLMKVTYCLQRQDIISGKTIVEVQEEWPYVFTVEGTGGHSVV
jgi:hypothetical protein